METREKCFGVTRRATMSGFVTMAAASTLLTLSAQAQSTAADPLPSWNDTGPKKAVVSFVGRVTKQESPEFVPEADRKGCRSCWLASQGGTWSKQARSWDDE